MLSFETAGPVVLGAEVQSLILTVIVPAFVGCWVAFFAVRWALRWLRMAAYNRDYDAMKDGDDDPWRAP